MRGSNKFIEENSEMVLGKIAKLTADSPNQVPIDPFRKIVECSTHASVALLQTELELAYKA